MTFTERFLAQVAEVAKSVAPHSIEEMVKFLKTTRQNGGRLFFIGSGGGAGHASHATCDFRKLCGFEAYCPTDNASELTARINDSGWDTSIADYLKVSKITSSDCVFVFSVGGGSSERNISTNVIEAIKVAKQVGAKVVGVVGRDGGYTAQVADVCVVIPSIDSSLVTPHTEAFQAVIWHLLVSHPDLQVSPPKWESSE